MLWSQPGLGIKNSVDYRLHAHQTVTAHIKLECYLFEWGHSLIFNKASNPTSTFSFHYFHPRVSPSLHPSLSLPPSHILWWSLSAVIQISQRSLTLISNADKLRLLHLFLCAVPSGLHSCLHSPSSCPLNPFPFMKCSLPYLICILLISGCQLTPCDPLSFYPISLLSLRYTAIPPSATLSLRPTCLNLTIWRMGACLFQKKM